LIVLRVTKEGHSANSRPCYNCLNMMKNIGIKKVYYTTDNENELVSEHVKDMISIQVSSVTKLLDTINKDHNNEVYYNKLLKTYFPETIKQQNLEYFINHNFKNIFPNYRVHVKNSKVYIYNENDKIVIESFILN
jgi:hypothetical protein